ncbi:methionine--tRNA ligase [Patescibacteria group bacterium]|nr:MAG: methionine--tRNA ligase [Patescibacteria group bacterium]
MNRFYLTTAIPYVNASPHIGFAMELIQADARLRHERNKLGKEQVFGLAGTDENSLKNVRAAQEAGEEVADFVTSHAQEFRSLWELLNLSFDGFIRTREEKHIRGAQKLWEACKPEDIYTKTYKGLYCVGCEQFYTEKEIEGGVCPEHKKPLEEIEEENYFFRLSHYQSHLEELIEHDTLRIVPTTRKNEILSFIRQGLEDFSISRSQERAQHWGVPVPGDESQVMYVWFDALSNYITGIGYADETDLYKTFWEENPQRIHLIGKGILRFHAVYWPAMLMSAGLPLPTELFVHGYITVEGEKMSKSLGNTVHPKALVDEYGVDAVRYYFLREIPSHGDGDFSHERMEERYAELANRLGNLVSRVAAMSVKYFEGKLDDVQIDWSARQNVLDERMVQYDYKAYLDEIFAVVDEANEEVDKKEPFKLVKQDPPAAKQVLSTIASQIRWIATALAPVLPQTSEEILHRYGKVILMGEGMFPRRDAQQG